jgi:archaellum biogenesis ATPase FlaH
MTDNKAYIGAVAMAKLGLKVLPLTDYTSTKKDKEVWNKIPRVDNWPSHATTDIETIKKWSQGDFSGTSSKSSKPCCHFGGSLEGFIVFDIDAPEAKEHLHNLFVSAGLDGITPTLTTRTGNGGFHFVFKQPAGYNLGNSVSKLAPKLDTRGGAGGYIVLPGTSNPVNDSEYAIVNEANIATLPAAVAEIVKEKVSPGKTANTVGKLLDRREGSIPDTAAKMKAAWEYLEQKEGGVEGAGGEADAVCVGRKLADIGLSEEKAIAMAQLVYSPKCVPSWDDCPEQLAQKIRNGYRYRESEIGCDDPDLLVDMFKSTSGDATDDDWKKLPFKSMHELSLSEPPPRETLLEDFMAHGKYLSLWYGAGGSGKSLLSHQFLRELTRRKKFLGLKPGAACRDFKGALISLEEPRNDVHQRFAKQSTRIVDPLTDAGEEPVWCDLRGQDVGICKVEKGSISPGPGLDSLIRVLKAIKPTLLVIDSLSRIFPGNENDRAAVTAFGRIMDKLVEETGCHVLLLAHTNKAGDFSGCSAWAAICRQMFVITSEKLDGQTIYTLTAEKTNEGERGAYVRYKFDDWYFVPVDEDSYDAMKETAGRSKTSDEIAAAEEALIDLLGFEGELQYDTLRKRMKDQGFDKGALDFAIKSAVAGERIIREDRYSPKKKKSAPFFRLCDA